jgi:hypothetical protein
MTFFLFVNGMIDPTKSTTALLSGTLFWLKKKELILDFTSFGFFKSNKFISHFSEVNTKKSLKYPLNES